MPLVAGRTGRRPLRWDPIHESASEMRVATEERLEERASLENNTTLEIEISADRWESERRYCGARAGKRERQRFRGGC